MKAHFAVFEVAWLEIRGTKREYPKDHDGPRFPLMPDDHDLIIELYGFMEKEGIYPIKLMCVGGGMMSALFTIDQGLKVEKWLSENGGGPFPPSEDREDENDEE